MGLHYAGFTNLSGTNQYSYWCVSKCIFNFFCVKNSGNQHIIVCFDATNICKYFSFRKNTWGNLPKMTKIPMEIYRKQQKSMGNFVDDVSFVCLLLPN
jgi:hypothetical protein